MWQWSNTLKLGKGSAFVKRDLRLLPLTEAEFEADFWLDTPSSAKCREIWTGMVIERESGAVLARKDVDWPPPTVNDLATLLAYAMSRPLVGGDRQRPRTVHLRDRPQWPELFPHLRQLGIGVGLADDLPWFDQAVVEWMRERPASASGEVPTTTEILEILKSPFPNKKATSLDVALALMDWMDELMKAGYPSARKRIPATYDPTTIVVIDLSDEELQLILTETDVARTKKLRPQLEAMVGTHQGIALSVHEWGRVVCSSCGAGQRAIARKRLMATAAKIARSLAEAVGFEEPPLER